MYAVFQDYKVLSTIPRWEELPQPLFVVTTLTGQLLIFDIGVVTRTLLHRRL